MFEKMTVANRVTAAKEKTRRALTPKLSRQWAKIANSSLARGLDDGAAIKIANGVLKRQAKPLTTLRKRYGA